MTTERIVDELEEAARKLGIEPRWEKGNFRGGRCTVGGRELVMLNKRHSPEKHLLVLAESLRDQPIDTIFLRPAVREALTEAWTRTDAIAADEFDVE
ncbi:MAG: hypothetical protein GVY18_14425 [Bacteroidetes bacterium]|jgi:hypothetical protein|nr:hypothetical protein [Bacteroidota bacterium]